MKRKQTTMKNRTKTKAFVFDFDDTLAHTSAVEREGTEDRFAEFNDPSTILNGTPLELMDLAKYGCLQSEYLCRIFKRDTGQTLFEQLCKQERQGCPGAPGRRQ
jgi:FMN phosphatase YigB (HAD superfamily)